MKFFGLLPLVAVASAHFTLDYPPTTGFDEDQEPNAPCGGFPPDLSNLTDYPLSGGEIAVDLHHPEALFLFRAQLLNADTWVNISDGFVDMVGLGEGCINALPVPSNWSGQVGVIQVVAQPPDGILYQCAGVKFVQGVAGTSSLCVNGTGITLTDTTQSFPVSNLSVTFTGSGSPSPSSSGSGASSGSPAASASTTAAAKSGADKYGVAGGFILVVGAIISALLV